MWDMTEQNLFIVNHVQILLWISAFEILLTKIVTENEKPIGNVSQISQLLEFFCENSLVSLTAKFHGSGMNVIKPLSRENGSDIQAQMTVSPMDNLTHNKAYSNVKWLWLLIMFKSYRNMLSFTCALNDWVEKYFYSHTGCNLERAIPLQPLSCCEARVRTRGKWFEGIVDLGAGACPDGCHWWHEPP